MFKVQRSTRGLCYQLQENTSPLGAISCYLKPKHDKNRRTRFLSLLDNYKTTASLHGCSVMERSFRNEKKTHESLLTPQTCVAFNFHRGRRYLSSWSAALCFLSWKKSFSVTRLTLASVFFRKLELECVSKLECFSKLERLLKVSCCCDAPWKGRGLL